MSFILYLRFNLPKLILKKKKCIPTVQSASTLRFTYQMLKRNFELRLLFPLHFSERPNKLTKNSEENNVCWDFVRGIRKKKKYAFREFSNIHT